jgi:hypothetical protein
MRVRQLKLGWFVALLLLAECGAVPALPSATTVLPGTGAMPGLAPAGGTEIFDHENIFDLVDGQAETFFAYGFEQVAVRRYVDAAGSQLDAEVWQMATPADAYGLFSSSFSGKEVPIGNGGDSDPGRRLAFWQNRYYVRVRARQTLPDAQLWTVAKAIAAALPSGGEPPAMLNRLPPDGLIEHSTIFFHQEISIQNELWLGGENLLGLGPKTDGVLAGYDLGGTRVYLLLVQYPDTSAASAGLEGLKTGQVDKLMTAAERGNLLGAVWGDVDVDAANRLLAQVLGETSTMPPQSTRRLGKRTASGAGYRQDENNIVVVHLRGSEAEMQLQYQALLADEIAGFRQAVTNHRIMRQFGGGCTNMAAFGPATSDGSLWHGRNFDFGGHGVLDRYRVVYIVEPAGKIPFVAIGSSGDNWNYEAVHTAMNAKGLSLGYMLSQAPGETIQDTPISWKLFRQVIENASTIEGALTILKAGPRKGATNLLLTDGKVAEAVVVESTSKAMTVRQAGDGFVYSTNHFVSPEMFYAENQDPNSYARFERLGELSTRHYGEFDLRQMAAVLRDRYDVHARRETVGGDIVATPSNMLSVIFHPSDLTFWVANGSAPAAYREFVGFSLKDELAGAQAQTSVPSLPADPTLSSAAWAEVEAFQAGLRAYQQSDDSTAAKRLADAMLLNPHCARYGYYRGVALVNLGREEEAITAFEAALAGDPRSSYAAYIYYQLGLIHDAMGAEDKMRTAFEQVLTLGIGDQEIEGYVRRALGR